MPQQKAEQFTPAPFQSPWWAVHSHIHTIVPSLLYNPQKPTYKRIEINTPDGDFLEIDLSIADSTKAVVALFHGLEGSSDRHYVNSVMSALYSSGFSSAALNFRGCGNKLNRNRRFYHSGATDDYNTLIRWLLSTYPDKNIYAVGYSLGANALVKFLKEKRESTQILRAVAVSPPYDLRRGSLRLHQGFNRLYEQSFLKTLVEKLEKKRQQYPDLPTFTGDSIYEFDDQVTAPLHGFNNADDYYRKCSSKKFYKEVQCPLLIIHSKDDPLCPLEYAPTKDLNDNPYIQTIFTKSGGHVGFISSPHGWLNRTIVQWFEHDDSAVSASSP
ncbi:MAG: alpha/beta fold hydrolase [Balneolaceae bacterium]|nr:alpha/beta fold hydrolase [Balneolaceae bacterium]